MTLHFSEKMTSEIYEIFILYNSHENMRSKLEENAYCISEMISWMVPGKIIK